MQPCDCKDICCNYCLWDNKNRSVAFALDPTESIKVFMLSQFGLECGGSELLAPESNTGAKLPPNSTQTRFVAGIDWLSGTIHESRVDELKRVITGVFRDVFIPDLLGSCGFYQRSWRSARGIVIGIEPYEAPGQNRQDAYLSIPAALIRSLSLDDFYFVCRRLKDDFKFRCSRIDFCLDDYSKKITPQRAYAAYKKGQVSGFERRRFIEGGSAPGQSSGSTLELGRRGKNGSGKFLRMYEKWLESDGKIDAARIELELSQKRARKAFDDFCLYPVEEISDFISKVISGAVDFVQRSSEGRLRNSKRVKWWSEFADDFGSIAYSIPVNQTCLEKKVAWFKKQVAPTFAQILNAIGDYGLSQSFIYKMWFDGEERLNEHQLLEISLAQQGVLSVVF